MKRLFIAAVMLFVSAAGFAQTYPFTTPTYIPNAILSAQTISAVGASTAFQVNGVSTMYIRIAGSPVGMTANIQGTESRASSPAWSNLYATSATTSSSSLNITGTGFYRVNVAGLAQVRLNVTALSSGSLTVAFSAGNGSEVVRTFDGHKATYSAVATLTPAASATDILTIQGSASAIVKVDSLSCNGYSNSGGQQLLKIVTHSVATTGGTSAPVAAVSHDDNDPAANASVTSFTANPTIGGTSQNLDAYQINLPASNAAATLPNVTLFGQTNANKPYVLGASEVMAVNGNGASFPAGSTINCTVVWTEE